MPTLISFRELLVQHSPYGTDGNRISRTKIVYFSYISARNSGHTGSIHGAIMCNQLHPIAYTQFVYAIEESDPSPSQMSPIFGSNSLELILTWNLNLNDEHTHRRLIANWSPRCGI